MRFAITALLALVGCYTPKYRDCVIACADNGCPSGLSCAGGFCVADPRHACDVTNDAGEDAMVDAMVDVPYPTGPWQMPVRVMLQPVANQWSEPSLTPDLLEIYVVNPVGGTNFTVFTATRTDASATFPPLVQASFNTTAIERSPFVSADGLTLMFVSNRTGTLGNLDLWEVRRPTRTDPWGPAMNVTELNSTAHESDASMTPDRLMIVFSSGRAGGGDLFQATRADVTTSWGPAIALSALNTAAIESYPAISSDGKTIWFSRNTGGAPEDIWTATRPDLTQPFGPPQLVPELNVAAVYDMEVWVSPDGHHLFFMSGRGGNPLGIYETSR